MWLPPIAIIVFITKLQPGSYEEYQTISSRRLRKFGNCSQSKSWARRKGNGLELGGPQTAFAGKQSDLCRNRSDKLAGKRSRMMQHRRKPEEEWLISQRSLGSQPRPTYVLYRTMEDDLVWQEPRRMQNWDAAS
jgi:hypothetical protein